ncbi:MAG: T9SS type A sorting domain-containing protein [Bacteroidota bacterium]
MKNIIAIAVIVFAIQANIIAQKHDGIWMFGHSNGMGGRDTIGISILDFRVKDTLQIYPDYDIKQGFNYANVSMCDAEGNYLFSSNGTRIYNTVHEWMEGGKNLNVNEYNGYLLPQGVLSLPHPRDSNIYAFFHGRKGYSVQITQTWYSEIDMRKNEGLGAVTSMESLIQDTLLYGQITAVKHGNGRDWWIPFQHYCLEREGCKNNFFYKILLNPDKVEISSQAITDSLLTDTGLGQAVFTPDGTKYIASEADEFGEPAYIDIYNFDRCTGELGERKRIETIVSDRENLGGSGLIVSPNSRFIYFVRWTKIFQYDLWAEDIQASEILVAEYDGFVNIFPTRFLRGQLASDNKIYLNTTNETRYLHVIHNPNEKGLACNVEQHGIKLPTYNSFSLPNHPNYRLGAWEGSPCDTIESVNVSNTNIFEKASIDLYPNPTNDVLNIEINTSTPYQSMEIQIYDLLGKQLGIFNDISSLPLNYPKGLYLLQIWLDQKLVKTEKLIIQE